MQVIHLYNAFSSDGLGALVQLITLHPTNADLWIKLAFCYAHLAAKMAGVFFNEELLSEPFAHSNSVEMDPKMVVCTCLLHAK
jgi:hypothetical protein